MSDDLHVSLMGRDEVREQMRRALDNYDWMFFFGADAHDAIDEVDEMVGKYPTYPTILVVPFFVTIIPRSALKTDQIEAFFRKHGNGAVVGDGQHIFILGEAEDAHRVYELLRSYAA